ncbi:LAGLIDADG family homing endonuclease [Nocardia sp. NPDC019255]|uniref:LAGLIDADG family homing endonuclease n=1 Tax=Nocardia sp. NPDC019255 TaxID=3154591 RepID=UPI0033E843DB
MFNADQAAHYLAAMIDGEGWVGEPKSKLRNRAIRIANTDRALIDAITECCDVLGIHYTVQYQTGRKPGWAPQWWVDITGRASFEIVRDRVPVRAPQKRDRIARTAASYRQPLDKAEIIRLYSNNMTQKQVAAAMGVSIKRLRNAMDRYGIPARAHVDRCDLIWRARREKYGAAGRRVSAE